ncbi:MAG: hypothetical protein Q9168_006647 [Polycauliona sp. 1 TL-2023]
MEKLLENLFDHLEPAKQDISKSRPSKAYTTWFGDTSPQTKSFVRDILTNITEGPSRLPEGPDYSQGGSPVFWALTEVGEFASTGHGDFYQNICLGANKTATAKLLVDSPYILICPFFWDARAPQMYGNLPPAPFGSKAARNCLKVNKATNQFILDDAQHYGGGLIQYRMWVMMEELLHYYINLSRGDSNDIQNANLLRRWPLKIRLETTQSYMYYAASLFGKCKLFPQPKVDREELRR